MLIKSLRLFFKLQQCIYALLFLSFISGMLLGISLVTKTDMTGSFLNFSKIKNKEIDNKGDKLILSEISAHKEIHKQNLVTTIERNAFQKKPSKLTEAVNQNNNNKFNITNETYVLPNYNVHTFYYPWYCSKEFDGSYVHWNHPFLQHWDKNEAKKWPKGQHTPPDDIGSNFYPELGPYSSRDSEVIQNHMVQIRSAGIGVIVVSWYPPGLADDNGKDQSDALIPLLLETAHKFMVKVSLHIEPFKGRSSTTMWKYIQYIEDHYGNHPAYYRREHRGRKLPMIYIYDSYLVKKEEWASILRPDGKHSVRNTKYDAIFIGLLVTEANKLDLISSGFDGFYTYFASDGFTYGSSTRHWANLAHFAVSNDILFIPSIGPGYEDTRVRPWNGANSKLREHGSYYEQSFKVAISVKPPIISITSFNEWHEGTQIEKAVKKEANNYKYLDYEPQSSDYYLSLSLKWIKKYRKLVK